MAGFDLNLNTSTPSSSNDGKPTNIFKLVDSLPDPLESGTYAIKSGSHFSIKIVDDNLNIFSQISVTGTEVK